MVIFDAPNAHICKVAKSASWFACAASAAASCARRSSRMSTVDEKSQVERIHCLIGTVPQLPRHAEPICRVPLLGFGIPRRRRSEEKLNRMRAMLHTKTKHIDDAALGNLALHTGQKLLPRGAVVVPVILGIPVSMKCGLLRKIRM
jgi:hypothetical protein